MELVLVAKKHNLVQVEDEELDGAEDREDACQKAEHLVIHFLLVLPEHLLQGKKKIMERHDPMEEPALDKSPLRPPPLEVKGGAQSNNGMWTGCRLDGDRGLVLALT